MINQQQFDQLIALLTTIAEKPSTITGMQDWPMLLVLFSMFGGVLLLLIGAIIGHLLSRSEADRKENKADHERIWKAHEDCQTECCPRAGRREGDPKHHHA